MILLKIDKLQKTEEKRYVNSKQRFFVVVVFFFLCVFFFFFFFFFSFTSLSRLFQVI